MLAIKNRVCFASYMPLVFLGTQKKFISESFTAEEKEMTSQKAGSLSPTRFSSEAPAH